MADTDLHASAQSLAALWLEQTAAGARPPDPTELAAVFERVLSQIDQAWPAVHVDVREFFAHLKRVADSDNPAADFEHLDVEDLYLAFACAKQHAQALLEFEARFSGEFSTAVARLRVPQARAEDARQRIWQKLFVGTETAAPRILEYAGRGRLRHWFRVAAIRELLDERRRERRVPEPISDDVVLGLPSGEPDPELSHLRQLYSHEFGLAFQEAVAGLQPEHRNTLRAYYAKGMTIDQIAVAFGTHRATAARRVARARELLMERTRECLKQRLKLNTKDLESILNLIQSQLHVSVARILG